MATTAAEYPRNFMESSFPPLTDRRHKRGRTDASFEFTFRSNVPTFVKYYVIHSVGNTSARKLSPFLMAKILTQKLGPAYKASKMSSGDILLELKEKQQVEKLLDVTSIGDVAVTISPHRSLNTSRGVISEEDFMNLSDEELLEGFQEQGVTKVQRIVLRRNNQEIPTKHVILTFATSTLPSSLEAGYVKVNVRPYIPNPRRCFKCQRFGHASPSCRGKATCAKCSSNDHESDKCNSSPQCTNCKGDHPAYSRSCPVWKKEKEVIAITVKEKISFYEARKRLSLLPKLSYANVVHQGAAPHRPREPTGSTSSSPAVAPPAPVVAAASAAPSLSKAPEIPVSQGLKTTRPSRPEARASASTLRSSSASAMEVDTKTPVSLTPKDQRSLERTKRDKLPVTAPKKDR